MSSTASAAKPAPLTIDREALIGVIFDAFPMSHDCGWTEAERVADAVMAHLAPSAQEELSE